MYMANEAAMGKMRRQSGKLQRQLQESNDRYELVAKATNDVIYDLDIAASSIVWNDALYSKYGYPADEPAGSVEWWAGHIHPDDAARLEAEISRLMADRRSTWQSQYRFRKANGDYAIVRDRAFVLRDNKGQAIRIIGSMLDITEAERLDRAKDEFSSLVSHQLRTPLTIIQLYSGMLRDGLIGKLQPDQLEYIEHINNASHRLIKLVSNILNISRIELDKIKQEPVPTEVNRFIQQIVDDLQPIAHDRHVDLRFKPLGHTARFVLDQGLCTEIVHNLITNAIHYSPEGKGRVEVGCTVSSKGLQLRVRDNGIGIPSAAQPHIFSRFYRADNAVRTGAEGTGLGLYLTRLIAEAMGGTVSFSSQEGKGTTFRVFLPAPGQHPTS